MAVVTTAEVQAWLEQTKLTIVAFDAELEQTARLKVFGRLGQLYDTTTWTDDTNTPELVSSVVAMYVAAWTYRRQYSEDSDQSPGYAEWLEGEADELLNNLAGGLVTLAEFPLVASELGQPDFYPKDHNYDEYGNEIDKAVFTMGAKF